MAGRQDQPAVGVAQPDQVAGGRRRQQRIHPDDHPCRPIGRRHPQDHLRRPVVEIAPVTAQNQRFASHPADPVKDGLHIVFKVMRPHEHAGFLAQPRCARLLAINRRGVYGQGLHCYPPAGHTLLTDEFATLPVPIPPQNCPARACCVLPAWPRHRGGRCRSGAPIAGPAAGLAGLHKFHHRR